MWVLEKVTELPLHIVPALALACMVGVADVSTVIVSRLLVSMVVVVAQAALLVRIQSKISPLLMVLVV